MLTADAAIHATLVGTWPALPLNGVILAHEAAASKIRAADVNRALMDAQLATLRMIANALTSLELLLDMLLIRMDLVHLCAYLDTVNRLVILRWGYGHPNGHVLSLSLIHI